MVKRNLSPKEILSRLRTIDALTDDGWPLAEALRFVRMGPDDFEKWQAKYGGVLRALGPLANPPPRHTKR